MSRLSDADRARVIELAKRGVPTTTIASAFGVSRGTIWRLTKDAAVPENGDLHVADPASPELGQPEEMPARRPRPGVIAPAPKPFAIPYQQTRSEIVRLRAKGMTEVQIASLLRIPYREVRACN